MIENGDGGGGGGGHTSFIKPKQCVQSTNQRQDLVCDCLASTEINLAKGKIWGQLSNSFLSLICYTENSKKEKKQKKHSNLNSPKNLV